MDKGDSVYGGNVVGRQLTGGVDLDGDMSKGGPGGFYDLGTGYSSPTGSVVRHLAAASTATDEVAPGSLTDAQKKLIRFDPDILAGSSHSSGRLCHLPVSQPPARTPELPASGVVQHWP